MIAGLSLDPKSVCLTGVLITLRRAALSAKTAKASEPGDSVPVLVPVEFRRRGVEIKLIIPGDLHRDKRARLDPALIKAVARGHVWFENLATGRATSIQAIADTEGKTEGYVRRLIRLALLAPTIVESILQGVHPIDLTAARLTGRIELPLDWSEQQQLICA